MWKESSEDKEEDARDFDAINYFVETKEEIAEAILETRARNMM